MYYDFIASIIVVITIFFVASSDYFIDSGNQNKHEIGTKYFEKNRGSKSSEWFQTILPRNF